MKGRLTITVDVDDAVVCSPDKAAKVVEGFARHVKGALENFDEEGSHQGAVLTRHPTKGTQVKVGEWRLDLWQGG